jgi:hypothetical protein
MTATHLRRLAAVAATAHEDLCEIRPDLQGHLLAGCLAQVSRQRIMSTAMAA